MALSGKDRKRLVEVVANLYKAEQLAHELSFADFQVPKFTAARPLDHMFADVVRDAEDCGHLQELLEVFKETRFPPVRQVVDDLLTRLSDSSTTAQPDPFLKDVVGDRLFLDRTLLRSHFKDLVSDSMSRVLVVTGPQPCGKSFTWFYVTHIQQELGGTFRPILLDLLRGWGNGVCTPYDLVESIANNLSLPSPAVDRHAQGAAQARRLTDWLVGKLMELKVDVVIVVDSLERIRLRSEAADVLKGVAEIALIGRVPHLRVVLLGKPPFTLEPQDAVLNECVEPVDPSALRELFLRLAEESGSDLTQDGADMAVDYVFRLLPEEPSDRIYRMSEVVRTVAHTLFSNEVVP